MKPGTHYASLMIAAGINAHTPMVYMGHTSITVTLDRYGHLMPGAHAETATRLQACVLGLRLRP